MGIIEDTHMPANGFSNLAIAFYISFLVLEPVQSVLLQKLPTAKFLGINGVLSALSSCVLYLTSIVVICWGIVLTMNCVCHNFRSLVALRVLLGVFESVTAPRYDQCQNEYSRN
jgi:hypothetical protein